MKRILFFCLLLALAFPAISYSLGSIVSLNSGNANQVSYFKHDTKSELFSLDIEITEVEDSYASDSEKGKTLRNPDFINKLISFGYSTTQVSNNHNKCNLNLSKGHHFYSGCSGYIFFRVLRI